MTTPQHDPRPLFRGALGWAGDLFAGVRPDQLTDPTPCTEFDVRTLLGHLASTIDRGRVIGEGGDVHTVPESLSSSDDDWPGTLDAVTERYWKVWSDDALLDTSVTAPWGTFPGRAAVLVSLNEVLVHGWTSLPPPDRTRRRTRNWPRLPTRSCSESSPRRRGRACRSGRLSTRHRMRDRPSGSRTGAAG